MKFKDLLSKITPAETYREFAVILCFTFFSLLTVYITLETYDLFYHGRSSALQENIALFKIYFILSVILGMVFGLVFSVMMDFVQMLQCIIYIEMIVNIFLIGLSFLDMRVKSRILIMFLIVGMVCGMLQVSITTFYGNGYPENDNKYTLLDHFILFILVNIICYTIAYLLTPKFRISRLHFSTEYLLYWLYMFMLICNIIALIILLKLKKGSLKLDFDNCNIARLQVIDWKQFNMISLQYCPLIIVSACVFVFEKKWLVQYDNMDKTIELLGVVVDRKTLIAAHIIIAILCVPFLIFLGDFRDEDISRIKLGSGLILIGGILSGLNHIYIEDIYPVYDYPILERYGIVRVLNNCPSIHAKRPEFPFSEIHTQSLDYSTRFDVTKTWEIFNQTKYQQRLETRFIYIHSTEADINVIIKRLKGREVWTIFTCKHFSPLDWEVDSDTVLFMKNYRRSYQMPLVFLVNNQDKRDVNFTMGSSNLTLHNYHFNEIPDGIYKLHYSGAYFGTSKFERGGMYVLFYHKQDISSDSEYGIEDIYGISTLIEPFNCHAVLLIPQYTLLILGSIIIMSSGLKISFLLPNSNVKCEGIVVLFLMGYLGYIAYLIIVEILEINCYYRYVLILLGVAICIIHTVEYLLDYQLLPNEIDATMGASATPRGRHGK